MPTPGHFCRPTHAIETAHLPQPLSVGPVHKPPRMQLLSRLPTAAFSMAHAPPCICQAVSAINLRNSNPVPPPSVRILHSGIPTPRRKWRQQSGARAILSVVSCLKRGCPSPGPAPRAVTQPSWASTESTRTLPGAIISAPCCSRPMSPASDRAGVTSPHNEQPAREVAALAA